MRQSSVSILILSAIFIAGCGEPEQTSRRSQNLTEGIRLSDIQPEFGFEMPTEMTVQVMTYEIDADNGRYVKELFEELPKSYLKFSDLKIFESNGFEAGFGTERMWPILAGALHRSSAKSVMTNNLLFMDSSTSDVEVASTYRGQSFYLSERNISPQLVKLPAGQLRFRVRARALPERKSVGLVQIEAVHIEDVLPALKKIPGYEQSGETTFGDISMKLNMTAGEFVVIGPNIDDSDQVRLSDLYFRREGDVVVPIEGDEKPSELTGGIFTSENNKKYRIKKNTPLLRLYVFACMDVKN